MKVLVDENIPRMTVDGLRALAAPPAKERLTLISGR